MSFLAELKRRSVFRVATVYAAVAFVVLQVASLTFAPLHLPPWAMTLVVVLAILGFPIALVLAWAFELTPEGVQRMAAVPAEAAESRAWIGKRTVALTAGLVILGVGLGAGWFLRPAASGLMGGEDVVTLAVLPFENLSGDEATEPFVLGVHDDLLTHLSRFDDLRVISRTSVMEYRNSPMNVREIATELGAGAVVEGGIQRSGSRVRFNVQLIDARTDEHLWAETYDRELTAENVFAIQAEIARNVAAALRAELAPAAAAELAEPRTSSLEALEAYHSGRRLYLEGQYSGERALSVRLFERAVELDPQFAEAWAGLASARSWLIRTGEARDTLPARQALDRALALDPRGFETRLASAFYRYYAHGDFRRAYEEFLALYQEVPGSSAVLIGLAPVERRLGRWDDAIAHLAEAVRIDPRNPMLITDLGWSLGQMRRFDEARPRLERALRLQPDHEDATRSTFAFLLWQLGDPDAGRAFAQEASGAVEPITAAQMQIELALVERDYARVLRAIEGIPEQQSLSDAFLGYGVTYTVWQPLLRAKAAWLAGDREAAARHAADVLRATDTLAVRPQGFDPWGHGAIVHLARALAQGYRGEVRLARERAALASRYSLERDAVDGAIVLDHLVIVYLLIGDEQRALDGIERLLAVPSYMTAARLRLDPIYDPLRDEPRFRRLVGEP